MWLIKSALFREILSDTFSRIIWFGGSLCIAGAAALLIYVVFPAFSLNLILYKEQDALHLTTFLVHQLRLDNEALNVSQFGPDAKKRIARLTKDLKLYKIRFYDDTGTIIHSTLGAEVGERNTMDYFTEIIAKGSKYSKLTRRNQKSLEGVVLYRDVVESYVPIMHNGKFLGAIELYLDVTDTYHSIRRLLDYMNTCTLVLAFLLFAGLTLTLLVRAKQQVMGKNHQLLTEEMDQIMRHDLKSPLSSLIHGFDILSQKTSESDENHELLHELKKVAYRMLHAINSSLTLSKIERGGFTILHEPVDISLMLDNIQNDMFQLIQKKEITVVIRQKNPQEHFLVQGDHALLYSIFTNLIKNAIEASESHKEIGITLFSQSNSQTIAIRNDGVVPEAIREIFFEKYVTSDKVGGTGFGTYGAKLMTEIQGGSIRLECNDEARTTTLYLSFASTARN